MGPQTENQIYKIDKLFLALAEVQVYLCAVCVFNKWIQHEKIVRLQYTYQTKT